MLGSCTTMNTGSSKTKEGGLKCCNARIQGGNNELQGGANVVTLVPGSDACKLGDGVVCPCDVCGGLTHYIGA